MAEPVRVLLLLLFIVAVFSLFIMLRFNPGMVDTHIEDGVGPSVHHGQEGCQYVVGIDLGTTYSSVAVYINDTVTIIPNEHGNLRTPSYVAFTRHGEPFVGDKAKNYLTTDPQSVVFDVMRFLGRKYYDSFIRSQEKFYPFNITSSDEGGIRLEVKVKDKTTTFDPEEILALILTKLKDCAESFLKRQVDCAVISVPAVFMQAQRHAVKDAAMIAGIKVVREPNTPSIATTGYISLRQSELTSRGEMNTLVYYLGGGTCEVSLVTVTSTVVQVSATNGTKDIGSEDFIHRILQHYFVKIKKNGTDIRGDEMVVQRLRREIERAMIEFYNGGKLQTSIQVQSIEGKVILDEVLTRATFDEKCEEVIIKTMKHIKWMLAEAKELDMKVKDIILLGGGTRIARVKDVIKSVFKEMKVTHGESTPGEAKVHGLALRSALIQQKIKSPILLDVSSYAIGLFLKNKNKTVIPQFSPLPFKKTAYYTTAVDNQENIDTTFYEGDVPQPGQNMLMYNLVVKGLRKVQAGKDSIEIQYELNVDGLLQVYAKEIGNKNALSLVKPMNILQDSDMKTVILRWKKLERKGNRYTNRLHHEYLLNKCVYSVLNFISTLYNRDELHSEYIHKVMRGEIKWLERSDGLDPVNFQDRKRSLQKLLAKVPKTNKTDFPFHLC